MDGVKKVIRLNVHRNSVEKRKARELCREIVGKAKTLPRDLKQATGGEARGFVLVVWNGDFDYSAYWDCGKTMPGNVMPEYVKTALLRAIVGND